MKDFLVLRVITKLLIPFILLFGLYVQLHGDYGAGGGFQAGVILASALILYAIVFDIGTARRVIPIWFLAGMSCIGLLLYVSVGLVTMIQGGQFLEYGMLSENSASGNHTGILIIEIGVGISVSAVMLLIFFSFAGRR